MEELPFMQLGQKIVELCDFIKGKRNMHQAMDGPKSFTKNEEEISCEFFQSQLLSYYR